MSKRSVILLTVVLFALVAVGAVVAYVLHPSRQLQTASQSPIIGKAQVGQPAPQFAVATTGGLFDLSKQTKPVFLEVFATWCPHCQRETAVIDKLYRAYGSRVAFVGVSGSATAMDGVSESSPLDVLTFTQRFDVRYPVAYDPFVADPNNTKSVANLYLQGGFPTFAVIGKDKTVTYLNSGELSYADLAAELDKVLG
ncbi:MAG: redoxin family protein [Candidatus Eremiobacteraeota bacterium]|nr:redoxin family protein [Candidatus Eremiobacteraeota bacterium]MBV8720812.1 redoxin family protein [Candidatus Eremiobacteraeota bacterium]